MRMAIAIVPGAFVTVISAGWYQAVEHAGQVFLQAWLKLDRAHRRRAAHGEHVDQPVSDCGLFHQRLNPAG